MDSGVRQRREMFRSCWCGQVMANPRCGHKSTFLLHSSYGLVPGNLNLWNNPRLLSWLRSLWKELMKTIRHIYMDNAGIPTGTCPHTRTHTHTHEPHGVKRGLPSLFSLSRGAEAAWASAWGHPTCRHRALLCRLRCHWWEDGTSMLTIKNSSSG